MIVNTINLYLLSYIQHICYTIFMYIVQLQKSIHNKKD